MYYYFVGCRFEKLQEDAFTYAFIMKSLNMIPDLGYGENWCLTALGDGAVKRTVSCETVSATSCIGVHSSGVPIQLAVLIA